MHIGRFIGHYHRPPNSHSNHQLFRAIYKYGIHSTKLLKAYSSLCSLLINHPSTSFILMKMALSRRLHGYSKLDEEDPEEKMHRRAQFLIYKVLEKADSSRKPSCVRIRIFKLKVNMGNILRRIKKRIFSGGAGFHAQVMDQVKALKKQFMIGRGQNMEVKSLSSPLF